MISLRVREFRGCERADIGCAPIALVGGANAMGKSSLAQAVGAVLTGFALPLAGITKANAGLLVHAGAATGAVELTGPEGSARVDWPAAEVTTSGTPPKASRWAAGLDSIALSDTRERAQILSEYLHAAPTREDVATALVDKEIGEAKTVDALWKLLEDQGWDRAHVLRKEKGVELKGRWRQVTNHNWGSRVGASWTPPGWSLDLAEAEESELEAILAAAKEKHQQAIGAAAVRSAERERQVAEAATLDERKDWLRDAEATAEQLVQQLDQAKTERAALPPGNNDPGMPCPHCGAFVVLRQVDLATRRLEKAEVVSGEELKKRRLAVADADGHVSRLTGESQQADAAVETARARMQMAAEAKNKLAQMPELPASGAGDIEVGKAALAVDDAQLRLNAARQKWTADDLHDQIVANEALIGILAPDGLRATKLQRVLDVFCSAQLTPLSEAAEWAAVAVDPAMTITYGGRPYALLSTSEQYRVRAVLAVAMARLDGSDLVVLDAADVLDAEQRSGLFALFEEAGLPALVCMTLARRDQLPELAVLGLGASYWIQEGIAEPLHQKAAA